MLSNLVISASASINALQARSMDPVNCCGSVNLSFVVNLVLGMIGTEQGLMKPMGGTVREHHFHPGASVSLSRRDSRISALGALMSLGEGSNSKVIENPGIFKLV